MITLVAKRRTTRKSPTGRKMTSNAITSKRRTTRSCTTATPLCQVQTLFPEKGVALCQDLLLAHTLDLDLAPTTAKEAPQITMSPMMTASQAAPSSATIHTPTTATTTTDESTVSKRQYRFCHPCCSKSKEEKMCSHVGNRTSRATLLCPTLYLYSR